MACEVRESWRLRRGAAVCFPSAAFFRACLPPSFTFFDRAQNTQRTPGSVLADVMGEIWLAKEWPGGPGAIPSTIQVVTEMANRIAGAYEINPVERRSRKRASLGLDVVG